MERRTSAKDVTRNKAIKDYIEFYKQLCSLLKEDNPFAKIDNGVEFYVWSDYRCDWHRMIDASEWKQEMVKKELYHTQEKLVDKIGTKTAQVLFSYPDDSYIYYNEDGGDLKVLITGWGFTKPARSVMKPEVDPVSINSKVGISFSHNGEKLLNYEFGLRLQRQIKRLNTMSEGILWEKLNPNETYTLIDFNTQQEFQLKVVEGQSLYNYDVTKYVPLTITANDDNMPLANEKVEVKYHDKVYDVTTDENGCASLQIPFYEGENVHASMRDQVKDTDVIEQGAHIEFDFRTMPDKAWLNVQVSVLERGKPVPNKSVTMKYHGETFDGITDANGNLLFSVEEKTNEVCNVSVSGYDSQEKQLVSGTNNHFVFDRELPPTPPTFLSPQILVKRKCGEILPGYPISVEYDGRTTHHVTNSTGMVELSDIKEGILMTVLDDNDWNNKADYTISSEQNVYEFIVPNKMIKVMFRDIEGAPIVCENVKFIQTDRTDQNVRLDQNGDTYFDQGVFQYDVPIETRINGWKDKGSYSPIIFTMDKDEDEYLLQEEEPKSNSKWWKILLEILSVLLTGTGLWFLWPLFEDFCWNMFRLIYN